MGIIVSLLGGSHGRTDDPDPVTGLTSRDKYLMKTSWDNVKKDITNNGVALLVMFFEKFPEEQKHFPFRDIPTDQLAANKKFRAHCNSVMYSVSSIVDSLNDSDLLVPILTKIGENHRRHNLKPASFKNLKSVMLELFSKLMTPATVQAWDKGLEVSFTVIGKQLE